MPSIRAASVAVAVLALGLPAGAGAAPSATPPGVRSAAVEVANGEVQRSPRAVLESLGLAAGPRTPLRADLDVEAAVRTVAEELVGGSLLPSEDEEWEWDPGSAASVQPAGDLDGDGLADVVVHDLDYATFTTSLRALSGADGRELWRNPTGDSFVLAVPAGQDLTGDGMADLVEVQRLILSEEWADDGETNRIDVEVEWRVAVVSGADGTDAWREVLPGTISQVRSERTDGLESSTEHRFTSTNLFVIPALAPSPDGGVPQLLLNSIDVDEHVRSTRTGVGDVGLEEGAYELRSATRASLRGPDGDVRWELAPPASSTVEVLRPAGGAVTGADLLWDGVRVDDLTYRCVVAVAVDLCPEEPVLSSHASLQLLDGETRSPVWTLEQPAGDGFALPAEADLDGDGADDILWYTWDGAGIRSSTVSGATGVLAWTIDDEQDIGFPLAVTDLDGGDGRDLILAFFAEHDDGGRLQVRLDRVDGASGAVLLSSVRDVALDGHGFTLVYAFGMPDADGDGSADVGSGASSQSFGWDVPPPRSDASLESGRTGDVLVTYGGAHQAYLRGFGDLDGDGLAEVLEDVGHDEGWSSTPIRAVDGRRLWTFETPYALPEIHAAGDADGRPGEEVVAVVPEFEERTRSRIDHLEGATGALRWRGWSLP